MGRSGGSENGDGRNTDFKTAEMYVSEDYELLTREQFWSYVGEDNIDVEHVNGHILIEGEEFRPVEFIDDSDEAARQKERLKEYCEWRRKTDLEVSSGLKQAMHDSLYTNPDQAEAYKEGNEIGVGGLGYAIWKLGWDEHVDGWMDLF